jgi:hypothetical protein
MADTCNSNCVRPEAWRTRRLPGRKKRATAKPVKLNGEMLGRNDTMPRLDKPSVIITRNILAIKEQLVE